MINTSEQGGTDDGKRGIARSAIRVRVTAGHNEWNRTQNFKHTRPAQRVKVPNEDQLLQSNLLEHVQALDSFNIHERVELLESQMVNYNHVYEAQMATNVTLTKIVQELKNLNNILENYTSTTDHSNHESLHGTSNDGNEGIIIVDAQSY